MPSKSKSQQRLFGMVTAFKKGELDTADMPENLADKVRSISKSISKKAARDFAKTNTKGKPEHVTEDLSPLSFKDYMVLEATYDQLSESDKQIVEKYTEDEEREVKDTSSQFHKGQKVKWKGKSGVVVTPNGKADLVGVQCDGSDTVKMVPADELMEKWSEEANVPESKKGMFKGRAKADLESELAKLKKSGPHKKGSPEYTKEKELMFAIRAKSDWGKVD